jgi:hypothetical protein
LCRFSRFDRPSPLYSLRKPGRGADARERAAGSAHPAALARGRGNGPALAHLGRERAAGPMHGNGPRDRSPGRACTGPQERAGACSPGRLHRAQGNGQGSITLPVIIRPIASLPCGKRVSNSSGAT